MERYNFKVIEKKWQNFWEKNKSFKTEINKNGEDMKGKFGRVLGDFVTEDGRMATEVMIEEGHCVPYHGQNKDDVAAAHLANRERLISEGVVKIDYLG